RVMYTQPLDRVGLWGNVGLVGPRLFLPSGGSDPSAEIPTADLKWYLHVPPGYEISRASGTVEPAPTALARRRTLGLLEWLYVLGGGVHRSPVAGAVDVGLARAPQ